MTMLALKWPCMCVEMTMCVEWPCMMMETAMYSCCNISVCLCRNVHTCLVGQPCLIKHLNTFHIVLVRYCNFAKCVLFVITVSHVQSFHERPFPAADHHENASFQQQSSQSFPKVSLNCWYGRNELFEICDIFRAFHLAFSLYIWWTC